jgi:hypothetical protein
MSGGTRRGYCADTRQRPPDNRTLLSTAQDKLKRVFLVFVVGWLGTFYLLRVFVWDRLKADLVFNRLPEDTTTEIVATDPFQVILLQ